jgi:hypothetical protein
MSSSYKPITKSIAPLICLFYLFINAATAQTDPGPLDTPRAQTESSKPSEEKRDDKIGSLNFLKGYITVYLLWQNKKPTIVFWGTPPFSYVFLDVVDGRTVIIRQKTNITNNLTGFIKTWEN